MDYDYLVVGSGIAGLTAAAILARHGRRIGLLEQAPTLGGSLSRFRLAGVPFDVGFHFTGGFADDGTGVLDEMLRLLGVQEGIKPLYYPRETCHNMIFPTVGTTYAVPCGVENIRAKMKRDFPAHRAGLDAYFDRYLAVIAQTPTLAISGLGQIPPTLDAEFVSLQQVLDETVPDPLAQAILGGFCMCYGTGLREVSFATHCRITYGLHERLARVEHGGQAFVDALVDVLRRRQVDIRTGVTIQQVGDIRERKARRFILTDGSEVTAHACILAIHPRNILALLPPEQVSKAFQSRIADYRPSIAFFALFGQCDGGLEGDVAPLTTILPGLDIDAMLTCRTAHAIDGPLVVLRNREQGPGGPVETVTALEVMFPEWTQAWAASSVRRRPAAYEQFKHTRVASICRRIGESLPECGAVAVLGSGSNLTFRDYLHSPDGSAYGIQQRIGQFNVAGRLPITNLYATGQSALLPGVIGAMTSAFLVCQSILGRQAFAEFLAGKACH